MLQQLANLDDPQNLQEREFLNRQEKCRGNQNDSAQTSIADWIENDCVFGDPKGDKTLALIGDSHADMWLWGLDQAGKDHGWKIVSLARTNCPYMAIGTTPNPNIDIGQECIEYADLAFDEILKNYQPFNAILLARTSKMLDRYVDPELSDELEQTLSSNLQQAITASFEKFGTLTNELLVLEDPPRASFDIPACLEKSNGDPEQCSFDRMAGLEQELEFQAIEKQAATQADGDFKIRFVPTGNLFCPPTATECTVVTKGGNITYRDSNHIAYKAAHEYSEQLAQLLIESGRLD